MSEKQEHLEESGFYAKRPNKSQQKRELAELKAVAERLATLDKKILSGFGFDDRLLAALDESRGLKASSARKRLIKFITKQLVNADLGKANAYFDRQDNRNEAANRSFHELEQWRSRIISEGDTAIQEFIERHPAADRQKLRQAMIAARKEQTTGKPVGAGKKLFRLLRQFGDSSSQA